MQMQRLAMVCVFLAAVAGLVLGVTPARSQPGLAMPGELPAIDRLVQGAILDSLCAVVDTMYVVADVAARTTALWQERFGQGAYKDLTDPVEYVRRLEEDANSVYINRHFALAALKPDDRASLPAATGPTDPDKDRERQLRRSGFGFKKVEILPGNVGYLRLDQFAPIDLAAETAAGAMNLLGGVDALIIDLRANPGGHATMIRFLAGYLFEEATHLIDWYERDADKTVQSWSADYVPGRRLVEVPLWVLTSDRTGSAAEEFSFDMKRLGRGTIVGDTTGGAGHTVRSVYMTFDGFRVGMRVPYGIAMNPDTGEGWEGRGVTPDIAVPAEQALARAQIEALKHLEKSAEDEGERYAIAWALADFENQLTPTVVPSSRFKEYTGTYGPRRIFIEGGRLIYQREGRPAMRLVPMGKDLFKPEGIDYFRLRFERDAEGRVLRTVGLYDNGDQEPSDRSR